MAGDLPGAEVVTFHVGAGELEGGFEGGGWPRRLGVSPGDRPSFVLLADPFSMDAMALLAGLDEAYPGRPKVGGMASGGQSPGSHLLFQDAAIHREGAVGLAITGAAEILPLVSQGCRPIGPRCVITKGEHNVIRELAGRPALGVIRGIVEGLAGRDRELASTGLLVGRVVDEAKPEFHRGDFLIRGLVGADEASGAVAVGDLIRRGQTIQLQVRDGVSADEDLKALLGHHATALKAQPPAGALVFACNGRGTGMYGDADHDSRVLREAVPGLPLAGFFCNGEVGPIGNRTFLHGFTSSVGFLVPR
jgi:small ligand-binding sensory domain FIST